jgi:peptidoglycan/LPS O-acetylase OafA/YrhL
MGALFPYWSLSLEEQFYLALPIVAFLARGRLPTVLVAIAASQFLLRRTGPFGDLMLAALRSDGLALGVLLAIWSRRADYRLREPTILRAPLSRWLLPPACALALALVHGPALGYPNCTMGLVAALSAAIVWVASYDCDYLFPPGRFKRALCWLGARSYGVYVIHVPVYFATREFWLRVHPEVLQPGRHHAALLLATSLPLIVLLAELNFRLVEDPLRRYGAAVADRIRRRRSGNLAGAVQNAG